jgi:hypothetical protein
MESGCRSGTKPRWIVCTPLFVMKVAAAGVLDAEEKSEVVEGFGAV